MLWYGERERRREDREEEMKENKGTRKRVRKGERREVLQISEKNKENISGCRKKRVRFQAENERD